MFLTIGFVFLLFVFFLSKEINVINKIENISPDFSLMSIVKMLSPQEEIGEGENDRLSNSESARCNSVDNIRYCDADAVKDDSNSECGESFARKCPSTVDFSTHFVIRKNQSKEDTRVKQVETETESRNERCPTESTPTAPPTTSLVESKEDRSKEAIRNEVASSVDHYQTPSVSSGVLLRDAERSTPPTPKASGGEISRRPSTAAPSLSYLAGSTVASLAATEAISSRPSTANRRNSRTHHPFMSSPLAGMAASNIGGVSPRTRLFANPESPMDNTYQPVSIYCLRKMIPQIGSGCSSNKENIPEDDSPFDTILRACFQRSPIPIDCIFSGIKDVEKIGEGVYGEVYSGTFRYSGQSSWVYKIVPIQGSVIVNGEKQKTFLEILPEVLVTQELSKLRSGYNRCRTDGFVLMRNARVAKGQYPPALIESWEKFNEKYESDNDRPDFFKPDQLFLVLEFEFAGGDIESVQFVDARQPLSIVLQVAHILAVGECALEFEHRDLHWGNILIAKCQEPKTGYIMNGQTCVVPTMGIKAVVIDFTMSRIKTPDSDSPIFLDIQDDEEQFLGRGDHQFDIYRMMRDHNRNDWREYHPKSNVFWLHYLANKLFTKGRFSTSTTAKKSVHGRAMKKLKDFSRIIVEHESATEYVLSQRCSGLSDFLEFLSTSTSTSNVSPIPSDTSVEGGIVVAEEDNQSTS